MLKTVSSITNAIGALNYKGTWNATTNSPALASGVGTKGDYYVVSVAGSTTLDGISNWGVGDWAAYNGSAWQRVEGGANLNGVDLSVTGVATFAAGSAAAPALTTAGDTNTGVYFPGADRVGIAAGGAQVAEFNGSQLQFNSGYGSVANAYGCRAWVNFGYVSSAITIRASGNVSSITRASAGNYFVNFSTSMPDANYAVIPAGSISDGVSGEIFPNGANQGASSCQINSISGLDVTYCQLAVFR